MSGYLLAQSPGHLASSSSADTLPAAPLSLSLTQITTDTGDMAPGHRDFARYTTPGWCVAAALDAQFVLRGTLQAQASLDTLQRMPERDTLPAGVIAVARACGRAFTIANTPPASLLDLFRLALLADNDTLAQTVTARWLALAQSDSARIATLLQTEREYLAAEPARTTAANTMVARIDAFGNAALLQQIEAHEIQLHFAELALNREMLRRETARLVALIQAMTPQALAAHAYGAEVIIRVYHDRMRLALADAPDSMPAIAREFQQEIRQLHWPRQYSVTIVPHAIEGSVDSLVVALGGISPHVSKPASFLTEPIAYRYPANGDTALVPHGKVALLVYVPHWCFMNAQHLWGNQCMPPLAARLQRWQAEYGSKGFVITVVAREEGEALMNGPLTPSQEADTIAWYLRNYLRTPVNVALRAHPTIQPGTAADQSATVLGVPYRDWQEDNTVPIVFELHNRNGELVYTGAWKAQLETYMEDPVFDPVLRRVMQSSGHSL